MVEGRGRYQYLLPPDAYCSMRKQTFRGIISILKIKDKTKYVQNLFNLMFRGVKLVKTFRGILLSMASFSALSPHLTQNII